MAKLKQSSIPTVSLFRVLDTANRTMRYPNLPIEGRSQLGEVFGLRTRTIVLGAEKPERTSIVLSMFAIAYFSYCYKRVTLS